MSIEERNRVARLAVEHAGETPVLVGIGALRTSHVAALPIYAVAIAPALGGASTGEILVAAYGTGNLLGSAGLRLRPLRSDAVRLMSVLGALVAATLTALMIAPTLATSLVGFCLPGVANAMFFAATLAVRSEFAPIESRGQIFIWVGALKIAAGSAGTAVAGAVITQTAWARLALATAFTAMAAATSTVERSRTP